jgi:multicomponent Na+:H+ antiporter subunit G
MTAALVGAGVAVVVAAALTMLLRARTTLARLHFLAPVTSVGAVLIGAGLAVANGWGLTTATVLLTVMLLAVTGPVLGAAMARLAGQHAENEAE